MADPHGGRGHPGTPGREGRVSFRPCLEASRAVRRAPRGPDVVRLLRPRGVSGVIRGGLPLTGQLYLAALQGRLIRTGDGGLALLDLPRQVEDYLEAGGWRARWLRRLDRYWDAAMFALPPLLMLATAGALVLVTGRPRGTGALVALVLALLSLLWVAAGLFLGVCAAAVRTWRAVERTPDPAVLATDTMRDQHWCVSMCHVGEPGDVIPVVAEVRRAIVRLSERLGGPRRPEPEQEMVLCLLDGFTTEDAERVASAHRDAIRLDGTRPRLMALGDGRVVVPEEPAANSARGIFFILGGSVVFLLLLARLLSMVSRTACESSPCPPGTRPGYREMLTWLVGRLFLDPGPAPAVDGLRVFGWLTTLLGVTLLGCVIAALYRHVMVRRKGLAAIYTEIKKVKRTRLPTFGLVTVLPEETVAMEALLEDVVDYPIAGDRSRYKLGSLPSCVPGRPHPVVITHTVEAGIDLAAAACTNLARSFPTVNCVIMVGIAAGVPNPDQPAHHVRLGDVVVATWGLVGFDHVDQREGGVTLRGGMPQPSMLLKAAAHQLTQLELVGRRPWERWLDVGARPELHRFARPSEATDVLHAADRSGRVVPHPDPALTGHLPGRPKVHHGLIGSSERSLRDARIRDQLAAAHGLRALEMEGKGIASSGALNGLEWLVVRGVSDYGDAYADVTWRCYASLAAAAYVRALLAECQPLAPRGGHTDGDAPQA